MSEKDGSIKSDAPENKAKVMPKDETPIKKSEEVEMTEKAIKTPA